MNTGEAKRSKKLVRIIDNGSSRSPTRTGRTKPDGGPGGSAVNPVDPEIAIGGNANPSFARVKAPTDGLNPAMPPNAAPTCGNIVKQQAERSSSPFPRGSAFVRPGVLEFNFSESACS